MTRALSGGFLISEPPEKSPNKSYLKNYSILKLLVLIELFFLETIIKETKHFIKCGPEQVIVNK